MSFDKNGWKVIGISGVTNGGKTSLSGRLMKTFPGSCLLNQDDYFRSDEDPQHVWIEVKEAGKMHQNWELVSSIDWKSFEKRIREILSSPPTPDSSGILLLEGHLLFNYDPLKHLFDIRYFLTLSKDVCSERRDARDYLPPDPPGYFDQIVWPMYLHNLNDVKSIYSIGQGNQQESITFLEGTLDPDFIFEKVVGDIKTLMSS